MLEVAVVVYHVESEPFEVFLGTSAHKWMLELVVLGSRGYLPAHRVLTAEIFQWVVRVHCLRSPSEPRDSVVGDVMVS